MQTNNKASPAPAPSLDDMLKAFDEAMAVPLPIGMLGDQVVYLHRDTREISLGGLRVSVDHQYLAGTAIKRAALDILET